MKKFLTSVLTFILIVSCMSGCTSKSELKANDPVTLTMWHVYGEQADSPMNRLIDDFNKTVGKERGVIIDVTMMSNSYQIGNKLLEAQANNPGAPEMPDLFFCHSNNAAALGADKLINWKDYFDEEALGSYVPDFVKDGMVDDKLSVFPVSKSTHLLFVAGGQFERFSAATGVTYEQLSTWEGFFDAAAKYYEWSDGKPFCALDYLIRCIELNAIGKGAGEDVSDEVKEQCVIMTKYEGYIDKQLKQIDQFKKLENRKLPEDITYASIDGLRIEARQKLDSIKPISIGQASRISGVSPADISVLLIYLEQLKRGRGGKNE